MYDDYDNVDYCDDDINDDHEEVDDNDLLLLSRNLSTSGIMWVKHVARMTPPP